MKTKEEIVNGLKCCSESSETLPCDKCPYKDHEHCCVTLLKDSVELITAFTERRLAILEKIEDSLIELKHLQEKEG